MTELDLVLAGGTLIDGTGSPGQLRDVGIRGNTIVAVGDIDRAGAREVIDVSGSMVAPGFVDAHGHSDIAVLSSPHTPSKIRQGITTEVMGNCGLGVAPIGAAIEAESVRSQLAIVNVDPSVPWRWRSMDDYLRVVEQGGSAMNVAMLAGHLGIRASCVGFDDRQPTSGEVDAMRAMTDRALVDGACGLSTGLMYPPNAYADTEELVALGEVVADHDAIFTFHMRDYSNRLLESVTEAITVARRSHCRVQISHLAVVGSANWGKVARALDLIDAANDEGCDVAADIYPYLAGSTNATQLLPRWSLEGGMAALLARLSDAAIRQRMIDEIEEHRLQTWDEILLSDGDSLTPTYALGQSVAELAEHGDRPPVDVFLDLISVSSGTATIVAFGRSPDDLRAALQHPRTMIGSDGLGLDPAGRSGSGRPHPRSYGCYPRLLSQYVQVDGMLTMEAAVHKSTLQVAQRFGLRQRGAVQPGYIADLVVFDPDAITDNSTYANPHQLATGVSTVIVSGQFVIRDGQPTGALPGVVLRRADG